MLSLRRRGRHVQIGLLPTADGMTSMPMARVIAWELDLLGSHGMAAVDYPEMLSLIESGALRPQELIERVVGLAEAADLLPTMDSASPAGMTMIDPRRLVAGRDRRVRRAARWGRRRRAETRARPRPRGRRHPERSSEEAADGRPWR